MTESQLEKLTKAKLGELILESGAHKFRDEGVCAMEAVAWLAGESHSDTPSCTCLTITRFVQSINDQATEEARQELKSVLHLVIGTQTEDIQRLRKRAYLATDFAVRVAAPWALDVAGLMEKAATLRALPPVADATMAGNAQEAAGATAWAAVGAAEGAARAAETARNDFWKKAMPECVALIRSMCEA